MTRHPDKTNKIGQISPLAAKMTVMMWMMVIKLVYERWITLRLDDWPS